MKLINVTKKKVIADRVIIRESLVELFLGLIPYKIENLYWYDYLKKRFRKDDAMLFKVSVPGTIHTFFMSFPITIVFLNEDFKVVEKVRLKPFRFYTPKQKYRYFVEVVGSKFKSIDIGNMLEIER